MTAFLLRAGAGVPGDCTRVLKSEIQTGFLNKNLFNVPVPTVYGVPIFTVYTGTSTEFAQTQAGSTANTVYGILVRMAPSSAGSLDQSFGSGVPNVNNPVGIGVQGYFNVKVADLTSAAVIRGRPVYLRTVAGGPGQNIGDLGTTLVAGQTQVIPGWQWATDGTDLNSVAEVRILKTI